MTRFYIAVTIERTTGFSECIILYTEYQMKTFVEFLDVDRYKYNIMEVDAVSNLEGFLTKDEFENNKDNLFDPEDDYPFGLN